MAIGYKILKIEQHKFQSGLWSENLGVLSESLDNEILTKNVQEVLLFRQQKYYSYCYWETWAAEGH